MCSVRGEESCLSIECVYRSCCNLSTDAETIMNYGKHAAETWAGHMQSYSFVLNTAAEFACSTLLTRISEIYSFYHNRCWNTSTTDRNSMRLFLHKDVFIQRELCWELVWLVYGKISLWQIWKCVSTVCWVLEDIRSSCFFPPFLIFSLYLQGFSLRNSFNSFPSFDNIWSSVLCLLPAARHLVKNVLMDIRCCHQIVMDAGVGVDGLIGLLSRFKRQKGQRSEPLHVEDDAWVWTFFSPINVFFCQFFYNMIHFSISFSNFSLFIWIFDYYCLLISKHWDHNKAIKRCIFASTFQSSQDQVVFCSWAPWFLLQGEKNLVGVLQ